MKRDPNNAVPLTVIHLSLSTASLIPHSPHTALDSTMSARALWYVAATKKSAQNTLYMHCNVKPGASKAREGVSAVDDEAVDICVAAQAREGEANKAVIGVLSAVGIKS